MLVLLVLLLLLSGGQCGKMLQKRKRSHGLSRVPAQGRVRTRVVRAGREGVVLSAAGAGQQGAAERLSQVLFQRLHLLVADLSCSSGG